MQTLDGALRSLGSSSRVVTVFEDPEAATDPAMRAARQGVTGLTRSIAHEMRRGGTANGLVLAEGVPLTAPGAAGALAFLLSGRAAYVSGQFVPVATADGAVPADAARPLAGKVAAITGEVPTPARADGGVDGTVFVVALSLDPERLDELTPYAALALALDSTRLLSPDETPEGYPPAAWPMGDFPTGAED